MKKKTAQKATESVVAVESKPSQVDISKIPVEIGGKTYDLCFSFKELAEAESYFRRQGHQVNLLFAMPEMTLEGVRQVFPCAVRKYHPELGWDAAQALVTMQSAYPIATAIVKAWNAGDAKTTVPVAG